eukprot:Hpha_TRINITY_DN18864_c0_g1::TRINITY_DN18864_c0_g1_i1::g.26271::m.26271
MHPLATASWTGSTLRRVGVTSYSGRWRLRCRSGLSATGAVERTGTGRLRLYRGSGARVHRLCSVTSTLRRRYSPWIAQRGAVTSSKARTCTRPRVQPVSLSRSARTVHRPSAQCATTGGVTRTVVSGVSVLTSISRRGLGARTQERDRARAGCSLTRARVVVKDTTPEASGALKAGLGGCWVVSLVSDSWCFRSWTRQICLVPRTTTPKMIPRRRPFRSMTTGTLFSSGTWTKTPGRAGCVVWTLRTSNRCGRESRVSRGLSSAARARRGQMKPSTGVLTVWLGSRGLRTRLALCSRPLGTVSMWLSTVSKSSLPPVARSRCGGQRHMGGTPTRTPAREGDTWAVLEW